MAEIASDTENYLSGNEIDSFSVVSVSSAEPDELENLERIAN